MRLSEKYVRGWGVARGVPLGDTPFKRKGALT